MANRKKGASRRRKKNATAAATQAKSRARENKTIDNLLALAADQRVLDDAEEARIGAMLREHRHEVQNRVG